MKFDPAVFGEGFHLFVQKEFELFGKLSPIFHIASFIILILIFSRGNRFRRLFSTWFTLNWLFLLGYWGVFGVIYWLGIGPVYLAVYIAAPVLLLLICINWIRELFKSQINYSITDAPKWRFAVLVILLWGLWYPAYIYGQGFIFNPSDLLFSYYGLMPCPTTMFVLSLMTIAYPKVNKRLYRLLTAYALFIGTATVASGWLPDIPFIVLGVYALVIQLIYRDK